MNNLKIVVYHPSLNLISDRTIRHLLKKTSSLAREIQAQEAYFLLNTSELEPSEKQSVRDRIKNDLNHIPAYYVERIEKGSISLTITVTAFAIWLLQTTVGQTLGDAWKTTKFHKHLLNYLSKDIRRKKLETNVEAAVNNWQTDRYIVEHVKKDADEDKNIVITIFLITPQPLEDEIKAREQKIDVDFVMKNSKDFIKNNAVKKDAEKAVKKKKKKK